MDSIAPPKPFVKSLVDNIKDYYAYSAHRHVFHRRTFFINTKLKIIFVRMDKCGGSSLVEYFKTKPRFKIITADFDQEYIKEKIKNNYKFYAVIREPNDRYITALNEFMFVYLKKFYRNSLHFVEKYLADDKFIFDDHTLPMHYRLEDIISNNGNLNLIKFNTNLSSTIPQIIGEKDELPVIHTTKEKPVKENYYDFCVHMFEKYCKSNSKFFELYKKDFQLYSVSS